MRVTHRDRVRPLRPSPDVLGIFISRLVNMVTWIAVKDRSIRPTAFLLTGVGICLTWVYWPTLTDLWQRWSSDPQYSHGYLVPVFALVVLWLRREKLVPIKPGLHAWGLPLILLGGLLRVFAARLYFDWLDGVSLLFCLAGVALFWGGKEGLRWSWPAIAFLGFMIPIPYRLQVALGSPLQRIATLASTYALQTLGFPAFSEGNIILLNDVRMGIVEACSGLSMLVIFFAMATAVALWIDRPLWEKLLIVLSAAPIAIVANVMRITVTGIMHETLGSQIADLVFHGLAGWFMMPLALGMLWVELRILSRLLIRPKGQTAVPAPQFQPVSVAPKSSVTRGNGALSGLKEAARLIR